MKRVVVTGIGVVSCLGNNQEEVYQSLLNSKSGITFSEEYKEYNLKSNIHGKPNIKLEDYVDRKFIRFMGPGSAYNYISMAEAVKDGALSTKIITIDPAPRATISELNVTAIQSTVEHAGSEPFQKLSAGDILFIDSSHILMPGSDVDHLLNRVLPTLPSGIIVHIHDIYLPDDYPLRWAWRGYNEQQGVAALLQGNGFEIIFSSHYAATRLAEALATSVIDRLELFNNAAETSLWLEKK